MNDCTSHHRHSWPSQRRAAKRTRIQTVLAVLFVIVAYGLVGAMDYEDAVTNDAAATQTTTI